MKNTIFNIARRFGRKYIKDNFVFDNDEQTYLPDLYRQIAAKLQINKDYKNSIVFYEKYLDFDLNNEEILIEKGICLISIEEFEKSLEIFIKIYDNNKSNNDNDNPKQIRIAMAHGSTNGGHCAEGLLRSSHFLLLLSLFVAVVVLPT